MTKIHIGFGIVRIAHTTQTYLKEMEILYAQIHPPFTKL